MPALGVWKGRMSDTDKSDKSTLRGLGGRLASLLKQWLVAPLIAGVIGTLVIGRVINTIIQPKNYKNYFIGDLKQDSATKIWSGLYRKEDDKLAVMDGVPIVLMQVNDFGDERTAERIS